MKSKAYNSILRATVAICAALTASNVANGQLLKLPPKATAIGAPGSGCAPEASRVRSSGLTPTGRVFRQPTISTISPASAVVGTSGVTLTITGSGFQRGSTVVLNNCSALPSTLVSGTEMLALLVTDQLAEPGYLEITVANLLPAGSSSNVVTFSVANPMPNLGAISPVGAVSGIGTLTLTIKGSNFVADSVVQWNGNPLTTKFVNSNQIQAQVSATDLATPGQEQVAVFNPAPGGGSSNTVTFAVAPFSVVFSSRRALDGSNAANSTFNVWVMNPDGSNAAPLTKATTGDASFDPVLSPDGTKIAFGAGSLNGSSASITVMNVDGSSPIQADLNCVEFGGGGFAWSPDSTKVAFAIACDGDANVSVMNADGSNVTPLTHFRQNAFLPTRPVWSPDGSTIAFASAPCGGGVPNAAFNIFVINPDGSNLTQLTHFTALGADSGYPAWSPDSSKIAFASARALDGSDARGSANIGIMNADGSNQTLLTSLTAVSVIFDLAWSPGSSTIAYDSTRALNGSDGNNAAHVLNIWTINADGSNSRALTALTAAQTRIGRADNITPTWSPDGSRVFFASPRKLDGTDALNTAGNFNIWVMNVDGSNVHPLTQLTAAAADSLLQ